MSETTDARALAEFTAGVTQIDDAVEALRVNLRAVMSGYTALASERNAAIAREAALRERVQALETALRAAKEKATTVFVSSEWRTATDWRERFLDAAGEHEIPPLDPQLVCLAVFDVMTFRDVHAILQAALAPPPPGGTA